MKLAQQRKPYWIAVAPGISLGYRRNAGPGAWNVRAADGKGGNWIKSFGIADDHEDADGANVLTFWQAADKAKALARGQDADAGRPATVDEALTDYAADLAVRGANATNATQPRHHLTPSLVEQAGLDADGERAAALAQRTGRRRGEGLHRQPDVQGAEGRAQPRRLARRPDHQRQGVDGWACRDPGGRRHRKQYGSERRTAPRCRQRRLCDQPGAWISTSRFTPRPARAAARSHCSMSAICTRGKEPKLMMPSSLKGKNRKTRTRKPMPIAPSLAKRLKQAAAGRDASEPLLLNSDGKRWSSAAHRLPFAEAAKAARLPDGATIYCLRHTAITRALLAGVPVRLVASSFDTSVAMIEKTYSKHIAHHGDDQMRRALFDADAPGNIIALVR